MPYIRRQLRRAHTIVRPTLEDLSIALVGDAKMAELHEHYMRIPGPTDVLTFELDHDEGGRVTQGEVVICIPEARRRAKERRSDLRDELLLYALHGMLHLCGFDDRTARGFRRMHRAEDEILTRLGVGPVFAPGRRPSRPPARAGDR